MTPTETLQAARGDRVIFTLFSPDTMKLAGSRLAVKRWLPLIRQNKPAILAVLLEEAAAADAAAGVMPTAALAIDDELASRAELTPFPANDLPDQDDDISQCGIDAGASDQFVLLPEKAPRPIAFEDERRYCTQCRNLMPNGRCAAAGRGELNTTRTYEPVLDLLQRCAGYLPEPGDPDQRTGRERRWPA